MAKPTLRSPPGKAFYELMKRLFLACTLVLGGLALNGLEVRKCCSFEHAILGEYGGMHAHG